MIATKRSTYRIVLAWRGAIFGHRLVETWTISRMPPSRVFGTGVAGFAVVALRRAARRTVGAGELGGVVGVVGRSRRRGHVVERPPGRWTGIMVHYRNASIRIEMSRCRRNHKVMRSNRELLWAKLPKLRKNAIKRERDIKKNKKATTQIYYTGYRSEQADRRRCKGQRNRKGIGN